MKGRLSILVVLIGAVAFLVWWQASVQVVKRRTDRLLELLSIEQGEGRSARQDGGYALSALLAAEVEVTADSPAEANGMFERERIGSAYSWLAGRVERSRFERISWRRVEIRGPMAEVEVLADVVVQFPEARLLDGRFRMFLVWEEEDGWRLARLRLGR